MKSRLDLLDPTLPSHSVTLAFETDPYQDSQQKNRLHKSMSHFRSTVGRRYESCSLQNYDIVMDDQRLVVDGIREYHASLDLYVSEGRNLMLFGSVGTGKDHLLAALMKAALLKDYTMGNQYHSGGKGSLAWVRGADLIADIGQRMFDRDAPWKPTSLVGPKILCISDLVPSDGALTAFQQTQLFRIVDSRYSHLKPIWFTANVSSRDQLEAALGVPVVDRLCHRAVKLLFNWQSYRR